VDVGAVEERDRSVTVGSTRSSEPHQCPFQ